MISPVLVSIFLSQIIVDHVHIDEPLMVQDIHHPLGHLVLLSCQQLDKLRQGLLRIPTAPDMVQRRVDQNIVPIQLLQVLIELILIQHEHQI